MSALTAKEIAEFRLYLKNCKDFQVQGVFTKERIAGRDAYAELAKAEAEYRKFPLCDEFQVIAGNVGTVYTGDDRDEAESTYNSYVDDSKQNIGRVAGESVTLMFNDEIVKEYEGMILAD